MGAVISSSNRSQAAPKRPQLALPGLDFSSRLSFGGALLEGRRKDVRFFDPKRALHLVLRSSQATGVHSLLKHKRKIDEVLDRQAQLHAVKIYSRANAGNHLHLVVRAPNRRALKNFLRAFSGLVVRLVLGRERGKARSPANARTVSAASPFWDARPFSRVVAWGKAFTTLTRYVHQNRLEAVGFTRPEARDILTVCAELGLGPPTT
ncbi:MAG: hypothetical protein ABIR96_02695 [Bdellovibrionota bacterium]